MDCTFDQTRPLDRLKGQSFCYCYDLSSATDRFPLRLMSMVLDQLFDPDFAAAVVAALGLNIFKVQFVKSDRSVSFCAGQPLGYYSSWSLFALTHHLLVMLAADAIHPGSRFTKYALLGDAIIICDERVAPRYRDLLSRLGVSISVQKSLISHRGAGEFAKRFRVNNMRDDISPVSVKALLNFYHPYGLMAICEKYQIKRFSTLCRIGGIGYKQRSRLTHRLGRKTTRLSVLWQKTLFRNHDVEWLLGRGLPLDPYVKGQVVDFLKGRLSPKDLQLPPPWCFHTEDEQDLLEWTSVRAWVSQWLGYVKWY